MSQRDKKKKQKTKRYKQFCQSRYVRVSDSWITRDGGNAAPQGNKGLLNLKISAIDLDKVPR